MKLTIGVLVLGAVLTTSATATTILVDLSGGGDFLTIQEGVNAASEGDTVLVAPGTYTGDGNGEIDFGGANLVLMSAAGAESTVIDVTGSLGARVLVLVSGEDTTSVLGGFTCADGFDPSPAVTLAGAGLTVLDCVLRGSGIYVQDGAVVVRRTAFDQCRTLIYGGGMSCERSTVLVEDSLFDRCRDVSALSGYGEGVSLSYCDAVIRRTRFQECGGPGHRWSTLHAEFSSVILEHATFWDNDVDYDLQVRYGSTVDAAHLTAASCTGYSLRTETEGVADIENSIIAFNGAPYSGTTGATIRRSCVFGNAVGDSLSCVHAENIFEDPLFCGLPGGVLTLEDCSPCLGAAGDGGDMGSCGEGCPCGDPTGVDGEPAGLRLLGVSNPARESCRFSFHREGPPADITVSIYSIEGRKVAEVVLPSQRSGPGSVTWNCTGSSGSRVASGVYPYRISDGTSEARGLVTVVR